MTRQLRLLGEALTLGLLLAVAAAAQPSVANDSVTRGSTAWDDRRPLTDINSAPKDQLTLLRGIGPKGALAIIRGRPYGSSAELLERGVLTPEIYDKIKDRIIARPPR